MMKQVVALLLFACVSASLAAELNFLVVGDWGGESSYPYTTDIQTKVATAMARVAPQENVSFIIGIGDNFYDEGIQGNDHSPRFEYTWQKVYTEKSLQVPWYLMAGNHDHIGNVSAEIAYSKIDPTHRWHYPDFWYNQTYHSGSLSVDIIYIDTVIWADKLTCGKCIDFMTAASPILRHVGNATADVEKFLNKVCVALEPVGVTCEHIMRGMGDFVKGLNKGATSAGQLCQRLEMCARPYVTNDQDKQLAWTENAIKNAKGDWVFVAGHYPVWSIAEHGPTASLVKELKPMLDQYKIPAYFNGHEHNMEHLIDGDVDYFVTGMGAKCDDSNAHKHDVPKDSLKFFYPSNCDSVRGGFATVKLTKTQMTVNYWDADGNKIYTRSKINPRA